MKSKKAVYDKDKLAYVEALEKLRHVQERYSKISTIKFINVYTPQNYLEMGRLMSKIAARDNAEEAEWRAALQLLLVWQTATLKAEWCLGVTERWMPDSKDYDLMFKQLQQSKFKTSMDALEGLIVQRLFELSKANLAAMGTFFL
ncbi:hypothetical protein FISHEDRAFT_73470 [Fistulina hepatica ATCC 64428]|uniref:Uncharacterized protein n=1 Tax=Fistulina hepatica ATCC 64428 TaxID=1128425 RepID=A0A0D7AD47_9AGAR|nr:hypothetical protein FISHEDRAFT_73470 [Fistulina hepatica ATCC 64428]